jgi:hypothetical protein
MATADDDDTKALAEAFRRLLDPLAQLAIGRGMTYAAVDEMARAAFVAAAYDAHPGLPAHRRASRVSAATGLHRREVQRLLEAGHTQPASRSRASEVFTHWCSADDYVDKRRRPRVLPRTGPAPSFESLAQTVTRDVHPRTLLEELVRLKLARRDETCDTVELVRQTFVPREDLARMAGFLGDNVGDHLAGAVANVLGESPRHFEQAIFADGLGEASINEFRELTRQQWKQVIDTLVPALERMVERDAQTESPTYRVRLGLYTFQQGNAAPLETKASEAPSPKTRSPRNRGTKP